MDAINKYTGNQRLILEGLHALFDELGAVIKLEREYLVSSNGKGLESLAHHKNKLMHKLRDVLLSGYPMEKETAEKIQAIHRENCINLKLFKSVLRLIGGYKKILRDTPFDTGMYTKKGAIHRREVSLRFNGTV